MDEIYVYLVDIPGSVTEMVVPCTDGYTIYIDVALSYEEKIAAYRHAMMHIWNDDHRSDKSADSIEAVRHAS